MEIYRETMVLALHEAIQYRQKMEKNAGFTFDSCYLATLKTLLKTIENGESVKFRD